jgi:hypothetical protein
LTLEKRYTGEWNMCRCVYVQIVQYRYLFMHVDRYEYMFA